eukprot:5078917-Prymnesium_polylepis.1
MAPAPMQARVPIAYACVAWDTRDPGQTRCTWTRTRSEFRHSCWSGARSERSTFVQLSLETRAIVNRVIRDNVCVCQRDSSHAIDRTQLQCCRRERCVSVAEVIGQAVVSEYVS